MTFVSMSSAAFMDRQSSVVYIGILCKSSSESLVGLTRPLISQAAIPFTIMFQLSISSYFCMFCSDIVLPPDKSPFSIWPDCTSDKVTQGT